jgi:ATP-dependent Clp protease adaptor protein ClpS
MKDHITGNENSTELNEALHDNTLNEPSLYFVMLHNDDFTPMDFVLQSLEMFFYMDVDTAKAVMLEAHTKGKARCGVYTKEVAESKIAEIINYARTNNYPLVCSMEIT